MSSKTFEMENGSFTLRTKFDKMITSFGLHTSARKGSVSLNGVGCGRGWL